MNELNELDLWSCIIKSQTDNFIPDETEAETLLFDHDADIFDTNINKNDNFLKYFENMKN